jgi:hypothetical protein
MQSTSALLCNVTASRPILPDQSKPEMGSHCHKADRYLINQPLTLSAQIAAVFT